MSKTLWRSGEENEEEEENRSNRSSSSSGGGGGGSNTNALGGQEYVNYNKRNEQTANTCEEVVVVLRELH